MKMTSAEDTRHAPAWRRATLAIAVALAASAAGPVQAATLNWTCLGNDWRDVSCWSLGRLPGVADTAVINASTVAVVKNQASSISALQPLPGSVLLINETGVFTSATADIRGRVSIAGSFKSSLLTVNRPEGTIEITRAAAQVALGAGDLVNSGLLDFLRGQITGTGRANLLNTGRINVPRGGQSTVSTPQLTQSGSLTLVSDSTLTVNSGFFTNSGTITLLPPNILQTAAVLQGELLRHEGGLLTGGGRVLNPIVVNNGTIRPAAGAVLALEGPVEFARSASVQVDGAAGTQLLFKNDLRFGGATFHEFSGAGNTRFGGEVRLGPEVPVGVRLQLQGSGTLLRTSSLFLRLGADGQSDSLSALSGLSLEGGTLKFRSLDGNPLGIGTQFTLFPQTALSGTFGTISASDLPLADGAVLDLSRLYTDGTLSVVAVPEPGTWLLMGAGLLALAVRGRKLQPALG